MRRKPAAVILGATLLAALILMLGLVDPESEQAPDLPVSGDSDSSRPSVRSENESDAPARADSVAKATQEARSESRQGSRSPSAGAVYAGLDSFSRSKRELEGTESLVLGTVVDQEGKPVSGARISVFSGRDESSLSDFSGLEKETHSRPGGQFSLSLDTPFKGWLVIDKDGYAVLEDFLRLSKANVRQGRYVLKKAADLLCGKVTDEETGKPIPGAYVSATFVKFSGDENSGRTVMRTTYSDPSGEYSMTRLPTHEHFYLLVDSPSHLPGFKSVRFEEQGGEKRLDIALTPAESLQVRVVDQDRRPIEKAYVRGQNLTPANTGPDGWAQVRVSREAVRSRRDLYYEVGAEGFVERNVPLDPRQESHAVVLELAPAIEVRVADEQGLPIPGAVITLWAEERRLSANGITDEEGMVRAVPNLFPVRKIQVNHSEYMGEELQIQGQLSSLEHFEFTLSSGRSGISGRVLTDSGQPAEYFLVRLIREQGEGQPGGSLTRAFSGTQGFFQILEVPSGIYEVEVFQRTAGSVQGARMRDLELREGEVLTQVDLRLSSSNRDEYDPTHNH